MKIYLTNYDLSKRADKTIYASQYSSFKAGIKVPGASDIKLYDGQTEISADASLFHGYKAFPLDAGDAGQKEYTVKADGSELKLKVVATDSAAAELNDKDTVFDLPVATATTLGGVKVGEGLSVAADGTLNASGGQLPSDISANSLTANSVDVGDSINLGNKITMGKSTSGGYITLSQDSKLQAVGPSNLRTSLDYDGLVINDGSGLTLECTMTRGIYIGDVNAGTQANVSDNTVELQDGMQNRAIVQPIQIRVLDQAGTECGITNSTIYANGPNGNGNVFISYDGIYINSQRFAPQLVTIDGVQYYVLAAQV